MVRKSERDAADDATVVAELEVTADQPGMARQRRLWNGAETERLGGQHEIADIGAAIDRAVDSERLVGVDDGDIRRAANILIFPPPPPIARLSPAPHPD